MTTLKEPLLDKVVRKFDESDKEGNDRIVYELIHKEFPRILNKTKHFFGAGTELESVMYSDYEKNVCDCNQGCCSRM